MIKNNRFTMSDSDPEVERIMTRRPPSSYGSMSSDDPEGGDDDDEDAPQPIITVSLPTRIKLHRPDSPETGVTAITHDRQTSVHNEGVYINVQRRQQDPGDVMETDDGSESIVHMREPQDGERQNIEMDPSVPEPTHTRTPTDELELPYIFSSMVTSLGSLNMMELLCFVRTLCSQRKGQLEFRQLEQEGEMDVLGVVDRMVEKWGKGEGLHITVHTLYDINKHNVANKLETACGRALLQYELRISHKRRYYSLYEGTCRPGQQRYIRHVYIESPMVIKTPPNNEIPIRTRDLFNPVQGEDPVRVVMTTGVPAIGLTVTAQMLVMDWTEEIGWEDFQFVFALPGRDLHLVRDSNQTFLEFLASFYPGARRAEFLAMQDCTVLFVIDALELCRQPLNFHNHQSVTDVTTPAPADVLLTSLIKGDLLPQARVWITAHRSACQKIPPGSVRLRLTELKGFGNEQKDEYFTKRTKEPRLGARVLELVKSSSCLYDACYLPLFSWIVSFVYEQHLQSRGTPEPSQTLTTFFLQYIIVQTNRKIERYVGTAFEASRWKDTDKRFLMNMGEVAWRMLCERKNVFYEDTVSRLALDMDEVTHRGGISSETFEPARENGRSFTFVHDSVQKFMAALYVFVTFRMTGENVLDSHAGKTKSERPISELYMPIIKLVLNRRDGDMDLFLRFLLGLAARSTERHLRGHLLPQYHPEVKGMDDVIRYARKKINENAVPERCRYLAESLSELEEDRNVR